MTSKHMYRKSKQHIGGNNISFKTMVNGSDYKKPAQYKH
jgi:hypothetical protein